MMDDPTQDGRPTDAPVDAPASTDAVDARTDATDAPNAPATGEGDAAAPAAGGAADVATPVAPTLDTPVAPPLDPAAADAAESAASVANVPANLPTVANAPDTASAGVRDAPAGDEGALAPEDRADAPAEDARPDTYRLEAGDTLPALADRFYGGDQDAVARIHNANSNVIGSNPDALPIGQEIVLPE